MPILVLIPFILSIHFSWNDPTPSLHLSLVKGSRFSSLLQILQQLESSPTLERSHLSTLNSQFSIQSHLRIRFRFWIVDLAVMVVAIATITAGGASLDIFLFSGTVCTFPNKMCFDEVYGVKARQRRLCAAVQGVAMPHEGGSSTSTITVPPFTLTTIVRLASLDLLSPTAAPYTNVQSQFPLILIELTTVIESLELSPTLAPKKRRRRRRSVVTCSVSVLANCSFTITTLWITADALSYTIFV